MSPTLIPGYALGAWLPTFYERVYDMRTEEYGLTLGLIVLVGGGLGCALGGVLSDRLMSRTPAAKAYVIAGSQLLAAPAIFGVLWVDGSTASFGLLVLAYITAETWLGPAAAVVQDITAPELRARASAAYIAVNTLVGGCGPLIVGAMLGDHGPITERFGARTGIRYALALLVPPCYVMAAGLFLLTGRALHAPAPPPPPLESEREEDENMALLSM
jgi:MFS family permease